MTSVSLKGARCKVVAGTHRGKSGVIEDFNTSKTGHLTITVRQPDGVRFKTLAKNAELVKSRR
jgi:ribosomal protein S4E